jgi:hypothetical protein
MEPNLNDARVVSYIRDIWISKNINNIDALLELRGRIVLELVTDRTLGMTERLLCTTPFRNDLIRLSAVLTDTLEEWDLPKYDLSWDSDVLALTGTTFENTEYTKKCAMMAIQPGSDEPRESPSAAHVYDLIIGRYYAGLIYSHVVDTYTHSVITPDDDDDICDRMVRIVQNLARVCVWDALGDRFFHLSVKTKLHAERVAIIAYNESPNEQLPRQYPGKAANDIGAKYMDMTPADRTDEMDWETSTDITDFVFAICILMEL